MTSKIRTTALVFQFLFFLFACPFGFAQEPVKQPITLGIMQLSQLNSNNELITGTVKWLQKKFGSRLIVQKFPMEDLEKAIKTGKVNFFLTSGGLYVKVSTAGTRDLATATFRRSNNPNMGASSVFITSKDRTDLKTIADLKNLSAAFTQPHSFVGREIALTEIQKQGFDPQKFFKKEVFTGPEMLKVIEAVKNKRVDVGVLRACYLEDLLEAGYSGLDDLKVIEPKFSDGFRCLHSCDTYVGFTFGATSSATPLESRAVVEALLEMPPTHPNEFQWSVATDFRGIDNVMKTLRLGRYEYLNSWTLKRIWIDYWPYIMVTFVVVAGWVFHSVRMQLLVTRQGKELQRAIKHLVEAQKEAREKGEIIEKFERLGAIQQMSSIIAHELKQPLTASGFYVESLIQRLQAGEFRKGDFLTGLKKIQSINHTLNKLIDRVRGYVKKQSHREPVDVGEIAREVLDNLRKSDYCPSNVEFKVYIKTPVMLTADKIEIGLLLLNLLKNAVDACSKVKKPMVGITIYPIRMTKAEGVAIEVMDNGPQIDREVLSKLNVPFSTTKDKGLGLGLPIVRQISESYGGRVEYTAMDTGGLLVRVKLWEPSYGDKK